MHFRTGSPENDAGLPVLQNMSNKFNSTNLIHIVQKKEKIMNTINKTTEKQVVMKQDQIGR